MYLIAGKREPKGPLKALLNDIQEEPGYEGETYSGVREWVRTARQRDYLGPTEQRGSGTIVQPGPKLLDAIPDYEKHLKTELRGLSKRKSPRKRTR